MSVCAKFPLSSWSRSSRKVCCGSGVVVSKWLLCITSTKLLLRCFVLSWVGVICQLQIKTNFASGFRIELLNHFPKKIHNRYLLATDTCVFSEGRSKKFRVRYIPEDRLSENNIGLIREHLSSFHHLYFLAIEKQRALTKTSSHNFIQMIVNSTTQYER